MADEPATATTDSHHARGTAPRPTFRSVALIAVDPTPPARRPFRFVPSWYAGFTVLGLGLLVWTALWWSACADKNRLKRTPPLWFAGYKTLGVDFEHNYRAANLWLAGGNPYREPFGDPLDRKLCYPPIVTPLFAWCGLVDYSTALHLWTYAVGGFAAVGAWAACRTRRDLGLTAVPPALAAALVLNSSPMMYALERGNYDILALPLLLFAAWALRGKSRWCDALAGAALALAAAIKVYPGLLVLGLLPLRRYRAFAYAAGFGLAFAAYQPQNVPPFLANLKELAQLQALFTAGDFVVPATHSVTLNWPKLWTGTRYDALAKVPAAVATAVLFVPLLAWVGYRVYRCPNPRAVAVPFFLWLAALATYVPKVSNDYNLFFLPLCAAAVWDRRDPIPVHMAMGLVLLWLQPLAFGIDPGLIFVFKVAAVFALAVSLVNRIRECSDADAATRIGTDSISPQGVR